MACVRESLDAILEIAVEFEIDRHEKLTLPGVAPASLRGDKKDLAATPEIGRPFSPFPLRKGVFT